MGEALLMLFHAEDFYRAHFAWFKGVKTQKIKSSKGRDTEKQTHANRQGGIYTTNKTAASAQNGKSTNLWCQ